MRIELIEIIIWLQKFMDLKRAHYFPHPCLVWEEVMTYPFLICHCESGKASH